MVSPFARGEILPIHRTFLPTSKFFLTEIEHADARHRRMGGKNKEYLGKRESGK